jgi:amino-acid N-acetyltransferase
MVKDVSAIHALITANLEEGRLLPRTPGELRLRASRFVVAVSRSRIVGCAELAPLGQDVAEIRSLVVHEAFRGRGVAGRLVRALRQRAIAAGFGRLCAFAHDPRPFLRWGFAVVGHGDVPEKIEIDCRRCRHFGSCTQFGVVLPLPPWPAHSDARLT